MTMARHSVTLNREDQPMTVTLDLPSDLERALRRRAAAVGQDVESFVHQVVAESLEGEDFKAPAGPEASQSFRERIESWIALHPVLDHPVDDSRESIYSGRDE